MLFHYAECRILFIAMPNFNMLSVFMMNVVSLSVVAPFKHLVSEQEDKEKRNILLRAGLPHRELHS
jgi:hypothetical protein